MSNVQNIVIGATKACESESSQHLRCNTIKKHMETLVASNAPNISMVANKQLERSIGHPIFGNTKVIDMKKQGSILVTKESNFINMFANKPKERAIGPNV